jgi:hypothetical protein
MLGERADKVAPKDEKYNGNIGRGSVKLSPSIRIIYFR